MTSPILFDLYATLSLAFIQKHGPSNVDIWDDEKAKADGEPTADEINEMYMEKGI